MTNTMPVLTEEQCKELIDEIDYNRKNCFLSSKTKLLMQIAEAALRAEPKAFRYAYLPTVGEEGNWHYVDSEHEASQSSGYVTQKLYAAPPVPALKLPDESAAKEMLSCMYAGRALSAATEAIKWHSAEVKRLNGVTE